MLNQKGPFVGYEEYLRPHLDLRLLALRNNTIPNDLEDHSVEDLVITVFPDASRVLILPRRLVMLMHGLHHLRRRGSKLMVQRHT